MPSKLLKVILFFVFCMLGGTGMSLAQDDITWTITEISADNKDVKLYQLIVEDPLKFPHEVTMSKLVSDITDPYPYQGMAIYLAGKKPVRIQENGRVKKVDLSKSLKDVDAEWIGFKGRFRAALVETENGAIEMSAEDIKISWPAGVVPDLNIVEGAINSLPFSEETADLRKLKYSHLPNWLRLLCTAVEWLLRLVQSITGLGWGLSLVVFTLLIKILTMPLSRLSKKSQEKVNADKAALEPVFAEIKKNYKGEQAHNKVMAAYKDRGITPYHVLKPLIATMITLPILIAIFNMLGEFSDFRDVKFLWVPDLAYPDRIASFPFKIPLIGDSLNFMPFLMAGVTVLSTWFMTSDTASKQQLRKDKRNLYLMALFFLVLFFPFPAAMVLFWTLYTLFQFMFTRFSKFREMT